MIRKFSRHKGFLNLKRGLGISLTLLLVVQIFSPGALAINAFADDEDSQGQTQELSAQQDQNDNDQGEDQDEDESLDQDQNDTEDQDIDEQGQGGDQEDQVHPNANNNANDHENDKVNVCHWSDEDDAFVALNISENGLNGHENHEFDFFPGELGDDVVFNSEWCMDHAPVVPPPDMGSLTVTKVVVGGTKHVSDFPLFVNGMPITSAVASTSIPEGNYTVTETGDPDYIRTFSGDCNSSGVVEVDDDDPANCTITNTFDGTVGGGGGPATSTATIMAHKVVCNSESDLPNWGAGGANITSSTASDYVASHSNCHLEPNWQFQWAPSGTTDPGMNFYGAAGSPWTTFGASTTITIPNDNFVWVREVNQNGYIPFTSTGGGAPNTNVSAEFYCNTDVLNYDNIEFIDNIEANHTYHCVGFNTLATSTGTTTSPFKVTILKYLDGVHATASSSGSYNFPFHASWDWTDNGGNHNGSGDFTVGTAGWGGSPAYEAFTADMTAPADYATNEITSNIDASSNVLPIGAQCVPGKFRLVGYRSGTSLANAQASSLSTSSPVFTDIGSGRTVIAYNETCPNGTSTPTTGTILVRKVVINDNGGVGTTSNFSFRLNGGTSTPFEIDGENSLTVATGTHNITEVATSTYTTSYNNCSNINVSAGETEICTITNNDISQGTTTGTIIVNKVVINNNNGTGTPSSFPLFVGSTSVVMGATTTLPLGTYTVSETYNSDLYAQSFSGDCNSSGSVTLSATSTKVCTITNHDIPQLCPVTEGMIESDTSTMVGTSSAALLTFIHPGWTADVDGASTSAKWIWSTNPVATTTATTTVTFTRTFTVNGSSTSATLDIATDNTYKVWINGNFVGESTDGNNFQLATQDSWNVSNFLVDGSNTLTIEVTNLPTPDVTDPQGNPAGLLYHLDWMANDCPVGGQGGDNAGTDNTVNTSSSGGSSSHKKVHRVIINANNDNDEPTGTVLGISTINPDTPVGRVLGIASTLPGLPNTGTGEIEKTTDAASGIAVIVIGLLVLSGVYVVQYRLFRKR